MALTVTPTYLELKQAGVDEDTALKITDNTQKQLKQEGYTEEQASAKTGLQSSSLDNVVDSETLTTNQELGIFPDYPTKDFNNVVTQNIERKKNKIKADKDKVFELEQKQIERFKAFETTDISQKDISETYGIKKEKVFVTDGHESFTDYIKFYGNYSPAQREDITTYASSIASLLSNSKFKYDSSSTNAGLFSINTTNSEYPNYVDNLVNDYINLRKKGNPDFKLDGEILDLKNGMSPTALSTKASFELFAAYLLENHGEDLDNLANGNLETKQAILKSYIGEKRFEKLSEEALGIFENSETIKTRKDFEDDKYIYTYGTARNALFPKSLPGIAKEAAPNLSRIYESDVFQGWLNAIASSGDFSETELALGTTFFGKSLNAAFGKNPKEYQDFVNERNLLDKGGAALYHSMLYFGSSAPIYTLPATLLTRLGMPLAAAYSSFAVEHALTTSMDRLVSSGFFDDSDVTVNDALGVLYDLYTDKEFLYENVKYGGLGLTTHYGGLLMNPKFLQKGKEYKVTVNYQGKPTEMSYIYGGKQFEKRLGLDLQKNPKYTGKDTWEMGKQIDDYFDSQLKARFGQKRIPRLGGKELSTNVGSVFGLSVGNSLFFNENPVDATIDAASFVGSLFIIKKLLKGNVDNGQKKTAYDYTKNGLDFYNPKSESRSDLRYILNGQQGPKYYENETAIEKFHDAIGVTNNPIYNAPLNKKLPDSTGKIVADQVITEKGNSFVITESTLKGDSYTLIEPYENIVTVPHQLIAELNRQPNFLYKAKILQEDGQTNSINFIDNPLESNDGIIFSNKKKRTTKYPELPTGITTKISDTFNEIIRIQNSVFANREYFKETLVEFAGDFYPRLAEYTTETNLRGNVTTLNVDDLNYGDGVFNIDYITTGQLSIGEETTGLVFVKIDGRGYAFPEKMLRELTTKYKKGIEGVDPVIANPEKNLVEPVGLGKKDVLDVYGVYKKSDLKDHKLHAADSDVIALVVEVNGQPIAKLAPVEINNQMRKQIDMIEEIITKPIESIKLNKLTNQSNNNKVDMPVTGTHKEAAHNKENMPDKYVEFFSQEVSGLDLLDGYILAETLNVGSLIFQDMSGTGYAGVYSPSENRIEVNLDLTDYTKLEPAVLFDKIRTLFHELSHREADILTLSRMTDKNKVDMVNTWIKILPKLKTNEFDYGFPADINETKIKEAVDKIVKLAQESDLGQIDKILKDKYGMFSYTDIERFMKNRDWEKDPDIKDAMDALLKRKGMGRGNIFGFIFRKNNFIAEIVDKDGMPLENLYDLEAMQKAAFEQAQVQLPFIQEQLIAFGFDQQVTVERLQKFLVDEVQARKHLPYDVWRKFNNADESVKSQIVVDVIKGIMPEHLKEVVERVNKEILEQVEGVPISITDVASIELTNLMQKHMLENGVYTLDAIAREAYNVSLYARPLYPKFKQQVEDAYQILTTTYENFFKNFKLELQGYENYDPLKWTGDDWITLTRLTKKDIEAIKKIPGVPQKVLNEIYKTSYTFKAKKIAEDFSPSQLEKIKNHVKSLGKVETFVFFQEAFGGPRRGQGGEETYDIYNYRRSGEEVWADLLSMLMLQPAKTKELAPNAVDLIYRNLDARPEFKEFFEESVMGMTPLGQDRLLTALFQNAKLTKKAKKTLLEKMKTVMEKADKFKNRDYRNLWLMTKLNSAFAHSEHYIRYGAGRPGPLQDIENWNPIRQEYEGLNLADMTKMKIDDLKYIETVQNNLDAKVTLEVIEPLTVIANENGIPYEVFESYLVAKSVIATQKHQLQKRTPMYLLSEAGFTEEQIQEFRKAFGDNFRTLEAVVKRFESQDAPHIQKAIQILNNFTGRITKDFMTTYMSNQTLISKKEFDRWLNEPDYVALASFDKALENLEKGVIPFSKGIAMKKRTKNGIEGVSLFPIELTVYKLKVLLNMHNENELKKIQFSPNPYDGFAEAAKAAAMNKSGYLDTAYVEEMMEWYKTHDGKRGFFWEKKQIAETLSVGLGDIFPYFIPGKFLKGRIKTPFENKELVDLAESYAKNLKRFDIETYMIDGPLETANNRNKLFEQFKAKYETILEAYKKKIVDSPARVRMAKKSVKPIEKVIRARTYENGNDGLLEYYESLPPSKQVLMKYVTLSGKDRQRNAQFRKEGELVVIVKDIEVTYEKTEDVAKEGKKVVSMRVPKQEFMIDKETKTRVPTGRYSTTGEIETVRVVVSDLARTDLNFDPPNILERVTNSLASVFQRALTTQNAGFLLMNGVLDAGTISIQNLGYDNVIFPKGIKWTEKEYKLGGYKFRLPKNFKKESTSYFIELNESLKDNYKLVFDKNTIKYYEKAVYAQGLVLPYTERNVYNTDIRTVIANDADLKSYMEQLEIVKKAYDGDLHKWYVSTPAYLMAQLKNYFATVEKANKVVELSTKEANYKYLHKETKLTPLQIKQRVRNVGVDFTDVQPWMTNLQFIFPFSKVINTIFKNAYYDYERDINEGKTRQTPFGEIPEAKRLSNLLYLSMGLVVYDLLSDYGFLGQEYKYKRGYIDPFTHTNSLTISGNASVNEAGGVKVDQYSIPLPFQLVFTKLWMDSLLRPMFEKAAELIGTIEPGEMDYRKRGIPFFGGSGPNVARPETYIFKQIPFNTSAGGVLKIILDTASPGHEIEHSLTGQAYMDKAYADAAEGKGLFSKYYFEYLVAKLKTIVKMNAPSQFSFMTNYDINKKGTTSRGLKDVPGGAAFGPFFRSSEIDYGLTGLAKQQYIRKAEKKIDRRIVLQKYFGGNSLSKTEYNVLAEYMVNAKEKPLLRQMLKGKFGSNFDKQLDLILKAPSRREMLELLRRQRKSISGLSIDAERNADEIKTKSNYQERKKTDRVDKDYYFDLLK
jgi:hypothetical protein